jgi:fatty-acyl-CoA synthase
MTETCGGTLSLTWEDHQQALKGKPWLLRSCGRGLADVSVKIIDPMGKSVAVGETGEICIRSNSNMQGYWNLPQATDSTLVDGWVHTGDAAFMDKEGYCYLRDRLKDMVISGGENIYPVEVENVLNAHPAILEVAVIGVPDERYGEALLAVVVLQKDKQLNLDELVDFGRENLAGYKVPRQLTFMDALPRNPSGKILKNLLRAPYWKNHEGVVA